MGAFEEGKGDEAEFLHRFKAGKMLNITLMDASGAYMALTAGVTALVAALAF